MAKGSKSSVSDAFRWDVYLVELASRIGVFGAVVLALLTLFILRGTEAQHREFIDKFFLLKWNKEESSFYHYYIITGLIVLFLAQYFYYKQRIRLKNERVTELINERDRLQNKLLKKF